MELHSEDGIDGEHDSGEEQLEDTDFDEHVESKLFSGSASRQSTSYTCTEKYRFVQPT